MVNQCYFLSPHGSCGDTLFPFPHAVCRAAGLGALGAGGGWLAPAADGEVAGPARVGPDAVAPAPLLLTDVPISVLGVSIEFYGCFHIIDSNSPYSPLNFGILVFDSQL